MTGAKLSRSHRPISYYREDCHPKIYPEAMENFKHFFKDKAKISWEERLEGIKVNDPTRFVYIPPVAGRPVGLLPFGYIRPEERPIPKNSSEGGSESSSESESGNGSGTDTTSSSSSGSGSASVEYDTDSEVDDSDDEFTSSTINVQSHRSPTSSQQSGTIYNSSRENSFGFSSEYRVPRQTNANSQLGTIGQYNFQPSSQSHQTPNLSQSASFEINSQDEPCWDQLAEEMLAERGL